MPARKGGEEPLDLDALLGTDEDVAAAVVAERPEMTAAEPTETAEQKRIRELEAELSRPVATAKDARPIPESQLTPDQRRIRELEDQLARRRAAESEAADTEWDTTEGGERILLHVLEDGFLMQGQVWYRGQEVEFVVGSEAYEQTKDRNGNTWLDLLDDIDGQFERWGKQYIKAGPWRGKKWGDTSIYSTPEEVAAARQAAEAERRRNRAAPVIR